MSTAVLLLPKSGRKPLTPKNIQLRTPPTAQKLDRHILPVLQISADNADDESNKENFPSAGLKSKLQYNLQMENLSSSSSSSSVSLELDHPHLCSPHECRTPFPAMTAIKRSGSTLDLKMETENKMLIVNGEGLGKIEHLPSSSLSPSSCMGYGIDGSLAEKLKGVRERNDRLRVEKQRTVAVLAEREMWLKRMEEEMELRTKEQEKVEAELDLVMALNGLKNVIVCGPRQSLRDQKMMEKATQTTNGKDLQHSKLSFQVRKEIERAEKFGQTKDDAMETTKKNIRSHHQLPVIAAAVVAAQT